MKIHELLEARRNPELNPKISINDEIENYAKANKGKKCYISFTDLEKLGVNPKTEYDTPVGVYCYPLEYAISVMGKDYAASTLPFAGGAKFANMFTVAGNVVDLSSIKESDIQDLLNKLPLILPRSLAHIAYEFVSKSKSQASVKTAGGRYWYIVWACASMWSEQSNVRLAVIMTKIFRKLGIDGLIDRNGRGIIHGNEKTQGVIFNSTVIKNVKRIRNVYSPSEVATSKFHGQRNIVAKQKVKEILTSKDALSGKLREAVKSNVLHLFPQTFFDNLRPSDVHEAFENARDSVSAMSLFLTKNFNKFLPNCEDLIKTDDRLSYTYAVFVTRARFIKGEPAIKESPMVWNTYIKKFPEAAK